MSLPRVVVDNSAILPAYFSEPGSPLFDAGLVTNRARSLVQAIRSRRVNAFVPPSFYREFLNVAMLRLDARGRASPVTIEDVRAQWEDVLSLPLIRVPLEDIIDRAGELALYEWCPPNDAWYVAAAIHTAATFWMSHEHIDGLVAAAKRHVTVRLLARTAPGF